MTHRLVPGPHLHSMAAVWCTRVLACTPGQAAPQPGHARILKTSGWEQEADLHKKQQQSRPQAAGQALRMLAAYLDAYTEATIQGGATKASVELRGLRVETKINLSGTTEVPPRPQLWLCVHAECLHTPAA